MYELKEYSVDELLKTQPKTLKGLTPIKHEENNYTININDVTIHDAIRHEIFYGGSYVIIKFFNSQNKQIANVSAFGSTYLKDKICKPDEHLYVCKGAIISETSFRTLKRILSSDC